MDQVWVINKGQQDLEIVDWATHKWVILKPGRPIPVRRDFALANVGKYPDMITCPNPDDYFTSEKLRHLIIRDAGIGDLLLLEPVLRKNSERRDVFVKTKFPDIYKGNPYIKGILPLEEKLDTTKFDVWDDLRNWSETAPTRAQKHRTDIYNEKFNLELDDKEPRIYYPKTAISKLKRKKSDVWFAIQCDASHSYRRYDKGLALAEYIIKADPKNHVALLGSSKFVKLENNIPRIVDFQEQTDLLEAIGIIRDCDYFIGGDSGLLHVACTMHIPAVGIFSIITPDLRLRYYTGPYKAFVKDVKCIGCGDSHMEKCNFGNKRTNPDFIAPCMDIDPKELYEAAISLPKAELRLFEPEAHSVEMVQSVSLSKVGRPSKNKLTMPIIVQNEEKNLPRFIELVMSHPAIGKTIAIDGGSTDKTVELLTKAGASVYTHPYLKNYHEMQAVQRNISCSYVPDGTNIIIMDIDECFSKELSEYLYFLADQKDIIYGLISRRTFNFYADINDPSKQIKDYPDWQPRFYKWDRKFKFVGGAHHQTLNVPPPVKIQKDIIHFEREGKDREAIEAQWKNMMEGVKKYGS